MIKSTIIFFVFLFSVEIAAQNFYFGDLHVHTTLTDGKVEPQKVYDYAKNVSKLDFICVTDHDIYFRYLGWDSAQLFANRNNSKNFISLVGYEYTNNTEGHRTVIYPENSGKLFSAGNVKVEELTKLVQESGGVVNIAHPNSIPYDSRITPLTGNQENNIEIISEFRFEYFNNPLAPPEQRFGSSVQEWLIKKKILGFIGVTDSHLGTPGLFGLTGIFVDTLSRQSIINALKARHTFATNGKKIKGLLSFGKYIMGDTVIYSTDYKRVLNYEITGTALIRKVEILKNNEVIDVKYPEADFVKGEFFENDSSDFSYYYLRAEQVDGGMLWTSPIYFLNIFSDKEAEINCYPNPTTGRLKIEFFIPLNQKIQICLYNNQSELIDIILNEFKPAGRHQIEVDFSHVLNGVYILSIQSKQIKQSKKFIKN